jgi:NAD(P)-dependent dehydrogenase (short-subunit alcohol dehydrogenase family)
VARAFAREGARVSLAGRTRAKLDELARDIAAASGNVADIAQVDTLDKQAIQRHAGRLVETVGGLDICFNAVGDEATLGPPLIELPFAEFVRPITRLVTAQFLIATAVARHMIHRNSGVVLTMTGSGVPTAGMGGAMTAWAAVELSAGSWRASSDRTASASCGCDRTAWPGMETTQPSERAAC